MPQSEVPPQGLFQIEKKGRPNKLSSTELKLDIRSEGSSMDISPPIHFRIEWADSQGKSPLLGSRPV
jgi:hypothetical protein